jgi:acetyl/propionyl-CoA carboxylase alpha subunit
MFNKVLIANRGEIAARIARTCKRLGMDTVAVYSDVDQDSVHCHACDEAVRIGPAPLAESYLNAEAILAAADATGADVIHPGYGLLSENADFARAVRAAGITFVGPDPDVAESLLDRIRAREFAILAGAKTIDGSDKPIDTLEDAVATAEDIGYPVVVKAVRSGAGVGPSLVTCAEELAAAIADTRARAQRILGDARVYLERAIDRPRHVEVQILADELGEIVALGDRECSIQRGSLRLLDESPAPSLIGSEKAERTRDNIWESAVRIAQEAKLTGAGAVEFLLDGQGEAYFLEVRPRLQVAHGITELCANVDLVEAQLLVAAGKPLPLEARRSIPSGHAMEVRISVDPTRNYGAAGVVVQEVRWPNASLGRLRIEASVQPGMRFTQEHDTLLAKVISYAPTRHAAMLLLDRVLAESALTPLATNATLLRRLLAHESFRAGQYDTTFYEQVSRK